MKLLALSALLCLACVVVADVTPSEAYGYTPEDIIERVAITEDEGVVKHVITVGTGKIARKGMTVHAHYDGKLQSTGKQFDSSRKGGRGPFTFPLGGGRVIKGWDAVFQGMAVGEKAIVEIQPAYGYGARGAGGSIPPNAVLYFEVELMDATGEAEL